jgi:hypothetical protein
MIPAMNIVTRGTGRSAVEQNFISTRELIEIFNQTLLREELRHGRGYIKSIDLTRTKVGGIGDVLDRLPRDHLNAAVVVTCFGQYLRRYRQMISLAQAEERTFAGQMGPAGPKGDPGPAGLLAAASAIRIIRSNCDATSCAAAAQCGDDEVMLIAYCGATRNPAAFPTEHSASCRLRNPANGPLIAACAKASIQ